MIEVLRTGTVFDPGVYAPATYRAAIDISAMRNASFVWHLFTAAAGANAATFNLYVSSYPLTAKENEDTNPATNKVWRLVPITFAANPGAAPGADAVYVTDNTDAVLLVEMVVAQSLPSFCMRFTGRP